MIFKTNASTVEAVQRIKAGSGFAAKAAAVLAYGCLSRRNATKAAARCSDTFTSSIDIQIPKHLQNKVCKMAKANGLTASEFFSGCAVVYTA